MAKVRAEETDLIQRIKEDKRQFESKYGPWKKEAAENYDMVAGDGRQWAKEARAALEAENRPCVEFDRLGTIVDAVSGSEINNRQETSYVPRIPGKVESQGVGEMRTAAARWVRDNCDAEDEESDAFKDVLIAGVGCTLTRTDYEEDEEGQILVERKDVLRVGWDARACKTNLIDRRSCWEDSQMTRSEIEERWPDKADDISLSDTGDAETDDGDELAVIDPSQYYKDRDKQHAGKGLVTVTRYQWYDVECIYKVAGEQGVVEMDKERYDALKAANPMTKGVKMPRRAYMEAWVCGGVELEVGPSPAGQGFSYEFITGKRDRNKGYWYGLVRPGKDPQRWANKFFSQILHIINTNAKGGLLVEKGAVSNVKKFEENWAKSDAIQELNAGGLAKIQRKEPANIPQSLFQTMEFAISSIRDCTGVNLELLGLVDRQQAGVLEHQRTQAGMTILAPFFSSLRLYRKRHGRLLAYFIREYISDGRLIMVVGEEGQQFIPLIRDPVDIDYSVVVDSAPTARDTKERTWQVLGPIIQMMQAQGISPPQEVFDYLPVPASLAQKLKQAVINHQPDPKQVAMQDADLANKAADTELKEAGAAEKYMKAQQPGIDFLMQQFGAGPHAAQPPPQAGKQGGDMQGLADQITLANNQLIQAMVQSNERLAQTIGAAMMAPKVKKAIRGQDGRIEGSIEETGRLQ